MTAPWGTDPGVFLTVGSRRLEYRCWGPAPEAAPSIVLLHEGLGSVSLWRDFPQSLSEATGFGVLAFSRAGYGQSDAADLPRPIDYMTREALDVLPRILKATGFRRGILMGHSDGASIAAIYAGSVSDHRVRGLVLMAPHFFAEPGGLAEIARAGEAFLQSDLRARMARHHRDPDHTFSGWNDAWLNPDFAAWNIGEAIEYLRVPVLAIQGRQDQYGTLAQIDELKNRSYAPVDVEIMEQCRHAPHLEYPERVLASVSAFSARLMRIEAAGPVMA